MLAHRLLEKRLERSDETGEPGRDGIEKHVVQRLERQHLVDARPAFVPGLGLDALGDLGLGDDQVLLEEGAETLVRRTIGLEVQPELDAVYPTMEPRLVMNLGVAVPELDEAPLLAPFERLEVGMQQRTDALRYREQERALAVRASLANHWC